MSSKPNLPTSHYRHPSKHHKLVTSQTIRSASWSSSFSTSCFEGLFFISSSSHFKITTNAWYRTHSYHPPFDVWLVLLWVTTFTLIAGYFEFSLKFIVDDEKYREQEFFKEESEIYNIQRRKSIWSFLGLLFTSIAIISSLAISFTDTADKRVMRESKERDMAYARARGIPVVIDGWFCICRSNVYVNNFFVFQQ